MITGIDYLNSNILRSFPIREICSRRDVNQIFTLPNSFIADASFSVSSDINSRLYISRIVINSVLCQIYIADQNNSTLGVFSVYKDSHTTFDTYQIIPTLLYQGIYGVITIGYIDEIFNNQPTGDFNFTIDETEFETTTITPSISGIDRITFVNANGTSFSTSGDV
jgi:hypothetical protein